MVGEKDAIAFLQNRTKFGIKLGLENIAHLAKEIGNPHLTYQIIHVAGTNGKGSTSSYISAILQQHGLKVGLYTSPHLVYLNERIRINGQSIPNNEFLFHLSRITDKVSELQSTFFDVLTAIAFDYFSHQKIDVAVIETGMGGRFDSTNIVNPMASVITSIGMDHEKYLGDTIEKIAYEKAGIIKPEKPVFIGQLNEAALKVIQNCASDLNSRIIQSGNNTPNYLEHNQKIAVDVSEYVLELLGIKPDQKKVENAVSEMPEISGLRGRFDEITIHEKKLVLDAAHNPDGAESLVKAYQSKYHTKPLIVFGAVADKNYGDMLHHLRKLSDEIYLTLPTLHRGNSLENLIDSATNLNYHFTTFETVKESTQAAIEQPDFERIVFCGSIYLLGEVYSELFTHFMTVDMPQGLTINQ